MAKTCAFCGATGHTKFYCKFKPRTAMKRSRIKRMGKHSYLWAETRTAWLKNNHKPYYVCHYCGKFLDREQLTLDHLEARSHKPELRYQAKNLVPACFRVTLQKALVRMMNTRIPATLILV